MNILEEKRFKIDTIDNQMIKLFEERMNVVKDIATYKLEHNLPVLNEEREKSLIEKNFSSLSNEELVPYYLKFIKEMISISKEYQKEIIEKESK